MQAYLRRNFIPSIFQEDEEEVVLATRLAVHGPILGPQEQTSFPGMGGPATGPLAGPLMVPTARLSPNDPTGSLMVL